MAFQLSSNAKWNLISAAVWGGVSLGIYLSARYAHGQLQEVRTATQISSPPDPEPLEFFTQSTEDAISEDTLRTLAFSPNLDMSEAARRLVIDRIGHKAGVWDVMIANVAGLNGRDLQEEALVGLKYFCQRAPMPQRERTLRAVVHCLRRRLPDVEKRQHVPDTDWKQRTQGERDAIFILRCEAENDAEYLLTTTDLVSKWLAAYPFGGPGADQMKRQQVVQRLIKNHTDDELLGRLLALIYHVKSVIGRKQLRAAGLIGSAIREEHMGSGAGRSVRLDSSGHPVVDGVTFHEPPETPGEHEGENEEARLRRRRRNTVVTEDSPVD